MSDPASVPRPDLEEQIRLLKLVADKHQRQVCVEPGCSEPAPPYCARHRGDWLARMEGR